MIRSSVVASAVRGYGLSERYVVDFLPANIQMPVSVTPSGMPAHRLDTLSELLEFLSLPSEWIEQLPVPGRPLTVPVTVGVPNVTTTTTTHPSMASTIGVVLVSTGALPSAVRHCRLWLHPQHMLDWLTCLMPVMHHNLDRLLPIRFVRLLGSHNQPALILYGSTLRRTSVETAGVPESETRQSESNGMVMLAPVNISSTLFVAA